MRVLTFLHSFEPGGVERIALRLVREWRRLGVDAPLFVGRTDGAMASDVAAGLAFVAPPAPRFDIAALESLWMILKLPETVRRLRPDMLFCAGNSYAIVAVMLKLRLGRDCPPIVAKISNDLVRHDKPWWWRLPYRLWLRIQGLVLDHWISMAEPMSAEIGDLLAVSADRITVVPDPALSTEMIARMRLPGPAPARSDAGRRFVAVGRLVPQKNIAMMLRAFGRGAAPDDRLTILGDGPHRARLETLAARIGLGGRVEFHGYVAEPAARLRDFDILLLTSDYEGVPAVVLEGLAANLWIVATECSRSMRALLDNGRLGELVEVGDEAQFAAAIRRASPDLQNEALSREQAERFTIGRAAQAYLVAFQALVRNREAKGICPEDCGGSSPAPSLRRGIGSRSAG